MFQRRYFFSAVSWLLCRIISWAAYDSWGFQDAAVMLFSIIKRFFGACNRFCSKMATNDGKNYCVNTERPSLEELLAKYC